MQAISRKAKKLEVKKLVFRDNKVYHCVPQDTLLEEVVTRPIEKDWKEHIVPRLNEGQSDQFGK